MIAQYRSGENRSQSTGRNRQPWPDLTGLVTLRATTWPDYFRSKTAAALQAGGAL